MRIVWTQAALRHLEETFEYVRLQSPRNASLVLDRIEASANALLNYPLIGRESEGYAGYRELSVPKTSHILVYRVSSDQIHIIALLHGAQTRPDTR